jgi:hypothetical protein
MKKYIAFILLIQLTLGACDDDKASNELPGKWKWVSTCGGYAGCRYSTSSDQIVMAISSTSITMSRYNTSGFSSPYEIQHRTDQDGATIYQVKITSTGEIWEVTIKKKELVIRYSAFTRTYSRIF